MSKKINRITDCVRQRKNANKHTPRGLGLLEDSIQKDGWIGAITVAADGETFDGSARLEVGASAGFGDAIVVESDGSKPVIVKRTDIKSADDEKARRLGIAANRIAQIDLAWDADELKALADDGMDLSDLFTGDEFAALAASEKKSFDFLDDSPLDLSDEGGSESRESGAARFPLSIVLTQKQMQGWRAQKENMKIADDTKAFLQAVEL